MLTTEEAAERLRLNPQTLERWRRDGRGPKWERRGIGLRPVIRYHPEDLEEWLAEHPQAS